MRETEDGCGGGVGGGAYFMLISSSHTLWALVKSKWEFAMDIATLIPSWRS